MATKAELQAQAENLGLEFGTSATKADLETLIAEATPWERPDPDKRCRICRKPADHVHA